MKPSWSAIDRGWMQRALALAELGRGAVAPNPLVGAVLVKDGRRLAEGWHHRLGGPHAEADCLRGLPLSVTRGAHLLVSLEPCCHTGRTPPCTELILRRGIAHVTVAMEDPNPQVAGQGLARLRAAGLDVECGLLQEQARTLNRGFLTHLRLGRPWLTLKWAQSLDGRITAEAGRPTTLSGAESRRETARLRARHGGILVGVGTVLADDPGLGLRGEPGVAPLRVVLDSSARLPLESQLVRTARRQPVLVACGRRAPLQRRQRLAEAGVRVLCHGDALRPPLDWVLAQLPALGVDSLLVEGGAAVHAAFLGARLADELVIITAPRLLGRGLSPVEGEVPAFDPAHWRLSAQHQVGADSWHWWRPANREA